MKKKHESWESMSIYVCVCGKEIESGRESREREREMDDVVNVFISLD